MAIIKLDGGYNALPISYKRGNPIPLDTTAVWYDLEALQTYARTGVTAYVGQVLSLVSEVKNDKGAVIGHTSTAYIIADTNGTLEPIGTAPIGDEKSIVVAEDGTVSLKGLDALVFERNIVDEDGKPTGKKEEVKYQVLMTKDGLTWVEPSKTTVEGLATLISDLEKRVKVLEDDRVTEEELAAAVKVVADKVGVPAEDDESTDTLYQRIAAEILRATQAEEALGERIGVAKDGETPATGVYAYVDGVVNALVNGVDPDKIDSLNELIAWVEAHPAIVSELDGRLDKVEGILEGFGGEEEPERVKDYIDAHILAADDKYATKQEIADADYAVAANVERDYAKKATTLEGYGITDAYTETQIDEKIGTPGTPAIKDSEGNITTEAVPGTGVYQHVYSKSEVTDLIADITGGESAADVKAELKEYKTTNDARVLAIEKEVWGVDNEGKTDVAGDSRIDKHANRILALETKVGHDVEGESSPATGLFAEIDEVNAKAEKGIADAAAADAKAVANAEAITAANNAHNALANIVNGVDNADSHAAKLAALAAKDLLLDEEIAALKGIDTTLQGVIAEQGGKITALESKDAELLGLINGKVAQGAFDALNAKVDIDGKVSTYVAEQIASKADDTAIKALITAEENRAKGEEARIEGLVTAEAGRADTEEKRIVGLIEAEASRADTEEKRIVGLVEAEAARAKKAEEDNAKEIARVNGVLVAALDNDADGLDSIKELADWINTHGKAAEDMTKAITKNAEDIANIYTPASGEGDDFVAASGVLVDEIARVENKFDLAVGTTIPGAIEDALKAAKKYTDDTMVKADGTSIENNEGTFSVKAVGVDKLVNVEGFELVLNGGNASTGAKIEA